MGLGTRIHRISQHSTDRVMTARPERSGLGSLWPLGGGIVVLALLAGCGTTQYEPDLDPQTAGPLTAEQAALLVDDPFSELVGTLSRVAGDDAELHFRSGGVSQDGGTCLWSSSEHAWTAAMGTDTWGELADEVHPAVEAWGMDDELLDRAERSAGAGLVAENPANGAKLEVQGWNPPTEGDDAPAEPGQQGGFSLVVTVPLDPAECG